MGGSHSSKVVVESDEKETAINVTRDVVERIKDAPSTTVIEQPSVQKRKHRNEHFEKLAQQNQKLRRILSKDIIISEPVLTDAKPPALLRLCIDKQQDILKCLKNNRTEPLKCSTEMAEFTKCIYLQLDDKRKNIM